MPVESSQHGADGDGPKRSKRGTSFCAKRPRNKDPPW